MAMLKYLSEYLKVTKRIHDESLPFTKKGSKAGSVIPSFVWPLFSAANHIALQVINSLHIIGMAM